MKAKRATNLQRQATEIVADPNLSKKRAMITEYNEPSADLINAQDHEFMQRRLKLLEGLSRGNHSVG
jgi:PHD/YefM family antitoxin component YafN of YafNO toxin-antitoxin module